MDIGEDRIIRINPIIAEIEEFSLILYELTKNYKIIVEDDNVNIKGNCNVTINGNCSTYIQKDAYVEVDGNYHLNVKGNKSGSIMIEYFNNDDFERILELLRKIEN